MGEGLQIVSTKTVEVYYLLALDLVHRSFLV